MYQQYQFLVFIVLFCVGHCNSTSCTQTLPVSSQLYSILKPEGVPTIMFNNVTVDEPAGCQLPRHRYNYRYSTCDYSKVLGDSTTVPHPPDLSSQAYLENFVAFQRLPPGTPSTFQFVLFDMQTPVPSITAIELSFMNNPTNRISLPDIDLSRTPGIEGQITAGQIISSTMLDNQELAESDDQIRTVVLQPFGPIENVIKIQIAFTFSLLHDFDYVLLSEVRFCTSPQPNVNNQREVVFLTPFRSPNIIHPSANDLIRGSIELVCSVSNEGQYEWAWEKDDIRIPAHDYSFTVGDGSRTTKFALRKAQFINTAARYRCIANQLYSAEYIVTYPVFVTTEPILRGYLPTGEVTLNCELHGYLVSVTPPVWLDKNETEITSSSKYTLSIFEGPRTIILENGTTVPSIILSVTVHFLFYADEGNYTCRQRDGGKNVTQLIITTITEAATFLPETTTQLVIKPKGMETNSVAIIAVATTIMALTGSMAFGILITLFVSIKRHRKFLSSFTQNHELKAESIYRLNVEKQESLTQSTQLQDFNDTDYQPMQGITCDRIEHQERTTYLQQKENENSESMSSPKLTQVSATSFYRNLDSNPIYKFKHSLEEFEVDNVLYNDTKSCETDNILDDRGFLETNPIYDSTPAAIGCIEHDQLLDGICIHEDDKLSKKEPVYSELLTLQPSQLSSDEHLNLTEFQEDTNLDCVRSTCKIIASQSEIKQNKQSKADKTKSVEPMNICEKSLLGVGQFGEVMLAETVGLSEKDLKLGESTDKNAQFLVAVKKLKNNTDNTMKESFEKEIRFMSGLSDESIVRMLAVCNKEPKFIVIEYMENGDLYQFLNQHELASSTIRIQKNQIPVSILLYMSVQIASGMKYLASLKYVHRDLAARNCLVGQNFIVKISDFGTSRNLYESVYYRVKGQTMLPIRWMATESFYGMFSEKTDIWSFGVTMWEIFTLGRFPPYVELKDQQIINEAVRNKKRTRLSKPEACPEDVYNVMLRCWEHKLGERANFLEAHKALDEIIISK